MDTEDPGRAGRPTGQDCGRDRERQTPPLPGFTLQPARTEDEAERDDRGSRVLDPVETEGRSSEPDPGQEERDEQSGTEDQPPCLRFPPRT